MVERARERAKASCVAVQGNYIVAFSSTMPEDTDATSIHARGRFPDRASLAMLNRRDAKRFKPSQRITVANGQDNLLGFLGFMYSRRNVKAEVSRALACLRCSLHDATDFRGRTLDYDMRSNIDSVRFVPSTSKEILLSTPDPSVANRWIHRVPRMSIHICRICPLQPFAMARPLWTSTRSSLRVAVTTPTSRATLAPSRRSYITCTTRSRGSTLRSSSPTTRGEDLAP